MRVGKWGDSLAVRLPPLVVELLGLQEGDEIKIEIAGDRALRVRPGEPVEPTAAPSMQATAEPARRPARGSTPKRLVRSYRRLSQTAGT